MRDQAETGVGKMWAKKAQKADRVECLTFQ